MNNRTEPNTTVAAADTATTKRTRRRSFLKGAAVATAAVGAGGVAGRAFGDDGESAVTPAAPAKGYRESAHIRDYYRVARF